MCGVPSIQLDMGGEMLRAHDGFVTNIPGFTCSLSKSGCHESKYYICTSGANTSSREYYDEKSVG